MCKNNGLLDRCRSPKNLYTTISNAQWFALFAFGVSSANFAGRQMVEKTQALDREVRIT